VLGVGGPETNVDEETINSENIPFSFSIFETKKATTLNCSSLMV